MVWFRPDPDPNLSTDMQDFCVLQYFLPTGFRCARDLRLWFFKRQGDERAKCSALLVASSELKSVDKSPLQADLTGT